MGTPLGPFTSSALLTRAHFKQCSYGRSHYELVNSKIPDLQGTCHTEGQGVALASFPGSPRARTKSEKEWGEPSKIYTAFPYFKRRKAGRGLGTRLGWLGLPRCFSTAAIHHPHVINIPLLSEFQTKAKHAFLSSISTSKDPMIKEISNLLLDHDYTKGQGISDAAVELLNKAKSSISTINSKALSN